MNTKSLMNCRKCKRLTAYLCDVQVAHPAYHCHPVGAFGDPSADLLIVGLAPGLHGANRTGRPFTGDSSGELLYRTLHKYNFASAPKSESADDGLVLLNCRITNAVKCLPPENRPTTNEIKTCTPYLREELEALQPRSVVLALGTIAHQAILRAWDLPLNSLKFQHGQVHRLPDGPQLLDSYHCSRYNTQTKRLTAEMFEDIFAEISRLLTDADKAPT